MCINELNRIVDVLIREYGIDKVRQFNVAEGIGEYRRIIG